MKDNTANYSQSASMTRPPRPLLIRSSRPPSPPNTFFCSWPKKLPIPFDFDRASFSASNIAFSFARSSNKRFCRSTSILEALDCMAANRAARSSASLVGFDAESTGRERECGGGVIRERFAPPFTGLGLRRRFLKSSVYRPPRRSSLE